MLDMAVAIPPVSAPPPDPTGPVPPTPRTESRALAWCAVVALAIIAWITMPLAIGILLGTLIAFTLQPLYERLRIEMHKPRLAALMTLLVATLGIGGSIAALGYLFVTRGAVLTRALIDTFSPGGAGNTLLVEASARLGRFGFPAEKLAERARDAASDLATGAASLAAQIVAATASALLELFFAMLTLHLILRNWEMIIRRVQETLPLRPEYTRALFEEFRRVGRVALVGNIGTGLIQGALAAIGYAITGVPEPIFFGALTGVASLLPIVGTLIVWVPVGIALVLGGHPGRGVLELSWGIVIVVGVSDYVIRPRLVGDDRTPALITLVALFGGLEAFGLSGIIVGPVLMALAIAVLRLYAREISAVRR